MRKLRYPFLFFSDMPLPTIAFSFFLSKMSPSKISLAIFPPPNLYKKYIWSLIKKTLSPKPVLILILYDRNLYTELQWLTAMKYSMQVREIQPLHGALKQDRYVQLLFSFPNSTFKCTPKGYPQIHKMIAFRWSPHSVTEGKSMYDSAKYFNMLIQREKCWLSSWLGLALHLTRKKYFAWLKYSTGQ